eukprot:m.58907 g.58907  ORF g.58907 m.58907 type:complete len:52 (-) comp11734_c0_seq1:241-396(-)
MGVFTHTAQVSVWHSNTSHKTHTALHSVNVCEFVHQTFRPTVTCVEVNVRR